MGANCPTCGRTFPKPKVVQPVDLEGLTDDQRYAYFKKTAPREDIAFVLRIHPSLGPMPDRPIKRDAMRMFDRARQLDVPPANEGAFWTRNRALIQRAENAGLKPYGGNWPPVLSLIEEAERTRKTNLELAS